MTRILGPAFLVGIVLGTLLPPFPLVVLALLLVSGLGLAVCRYPHHCAGRSDPGCRCAGYESLPRHGDCLCLQSVGTLPRTDCHHPRLGGIRAAALRPQHPGEVSRGGHADRRRLAASLRPGVGDAISQVPGALRHGRGRSAGRLEAVESVNSPGYQRYLERLGIQAHCWHFRGWSLCRANAASRSCARSTG